MSGEIQGVVGQVAEFKTNTGKTVYSIVVDGKKYSAGFDKPPCQIGDNVAFGTVMNGQYINVAKNSIRVLPPSAGNTGGVARQPAAGANNYADRQDTISRQAASNTALQFVTLAHSIEALDIKKTAKADDKLAALEALVTQYTIFFYEQNTGVEYKSIAPAHEAELNGEAPTPATWQ